MATLNREAVYQALFDLVGSDATVQALFKTTGRFLLHHASVPDDQCPALFTFQLPERREYQGKGMEAKRSLLVAYIAYFATPPDLSTLPCTAVNAAMDALDDAISYPGNPQNVQTLGGLVEYVRIEPDMKPYEGLLQEKSILVAVVRALVP